jgi:hypothetical protein
MGAALQPSARVRSRVRPLVALGGVALVGAAVAKELRMPARKRRWHGRLGPIPYDLRPPTAARVRQRMWDPNGSLIGPHVLGVGWTVNLGRLVALARRRLGR